ncbi:MAG TPA: hypothetical protein VII36_01650, partial [Usitatibacter sp.]
MRLAHVRIQRGGTPEFLGRLGPTLPVQQQKAMRVEKGRRGGGPHRERRGDFPKRRVDIALHREGERELASRFRVGRILREKHAVSRNGRLQIARLLEPERAETQHVFAMRADLEGLAIGFRSGRAAAGVLQHASRVKARFDGSGIEGQGPAKAGERLVA